MSASWWAIGATSRTCAIGLGVPILVALPAGLLLGSSSSLLYRTIPPVALIPARPSFQL